MIKVYDCFLFNNEEELLEIRLQLLSKIVDKFVIVWAAETFTGRKKEQSFPWHNEIVSRFATKVELITIEKLKGLNAWEKEWYSRNRLADGLKNLHADDLVIISDIDEIPRPSIIIDLCSKKLNQIKVLGLDYYNFKFNYKLVHGTQVVWAGPVVCSYKDFTTPQQLRDLRWHAMYNPDQLIEDAGWHFSFLTKSKDVIDKLTSFAHQESEVQSRIDDVDQLIEKRQGFSDHLQPGSVWAVVSFDDFACRELIALVSNYPDLCLSGLFDDELTIKRKIRSSIHHLCVNERAKVLRWCTRTELFSELKRRIINRAKSAFGLKWFNCF